MEDESRWEVMIKNLIKVVRNMGCTGRKEECTFIMERTQKRRAAVLMPTVERSGRRRTASQSQRWYTAGKSTAKGINTTSKYPSFHAMVSDPITKIYLQSLVSPETLFPSGSKV
jgi:hypothetical protein